MAEERRTELVRILARIDQRIAHAKGLIDEPADADTRQRVAKVLAELWQSRREVEWELRGE